MPATPCHRCNSLQMCHPHELSRVNDTSGITSRGVTAVESDLAPHKRGAMPHDAQDSLICGSSAGG